MGYDGIGWDRVEWQKVRWKGRDGREWAAMRRNGIEGSALV